jgi:hypothetical protein
MRRNGFGDLNPRTLDERHRKVSVETTGVKYIRDSFIQSNDTIKDSLKSKGPYMAEVLKVFNDPADQKTTKSSSGFNLWGSVESRPNDIITIVARIPEIHHFCLPENLPLSVSVENDTYEQDAKIIDMYPRFVAESSGLAIPKVGQKVWVDFEDEVNYYGGKYLGIVDPNEVVAPSKVTKKRKSPKKAVKKAKAKKADSAEAKKAAADAAAAKVAADNAAAARRASKTIPKKVETLPPKEKKEATSALSVVTLEDAEKHKENRVRLFSFEELQRSSELLVDVPKKYIIGNAKVKIHKLLLPRFIAMNEAWIAHPDSKIGGKPTYLKFTSAATGWRRHYYEKDYEVYRDEMFKQYKNRTDIEIFKELKEAHKNNPKVWRIKVADKARMRKAFASPHCTGLAMDLTHLIPHAKMKNGKQYYDGITPTTKEAYKRSAKKQKQEFQKYKKKIKKKPLKEGEEELTLKDFAIKQSRGVRKNRQRKSKQWKWLEKNAGKFGITPYKHEPWHWELMPPRENYFSAEEYALDDRGYAIRTLEKSTKEYPYNILIKGVPRQIGFHENKGKFLTTTNKQFAWVPFGGPTPKSYIKN